MERKKIGWNCVKAQKAERDSKSEIDKKKSSRVLCFVTAATPRDGV